MFRNLIVATLLLGFATVASANGLATSADKIRPILIGSAMPDVALTTLAGKPTTLKSQVAGKPAILVFYRGGWCPYCNLQLSDLRLIQKQTKALGYQMIAISPDRPQELNRTLGKQKLAYSLLSDS